MTLCRYTMVIIFYVSFETNKIKNQIETISKNSVMIDFFMFWNCSGCFYVGRWVYNRFLALFAKPKLTSTAGIRLKTRCIIQPWLNPSPPPAKETLAGCFSGGPHDEEGGTAGCVYSVSAPLLLIRVQRRWLYCLSKAIRMGASRSQHNRSDCESEIKALCNPCNQSIIEYCFPWERTLLKVVVSTYGLTPSLKVFWLRFYLNT